MQPTFAVPAAGGSATTIFGTLGVIIVIIVVVMGGLFAFKRFYAKQNPNISMHFQNTRSAMAAARVKMCKFNEIRVCRQSNSYKRNGMPPPSSASAAATMIDEQDITDLTSRHHNDDTRNLLS